MRQVFTSDEGGNLVLDQMAEESRQTAIEAFPKLRQSLLSDFDTCALESKFRADYETFDSHPAARGHIFHKVAARCLEAMAQMQEFGIEVDVALAILHETLRQADVPPDEVQNVPMAVVKDLYWVVKKWAHDNEFDIQHLVDVEQRLDIPLTYEAADKGNVERILTGQLDALFIEGDHAETAIVLDWKDTWSMPAPSEVSFEGFFQQRFYGWLVMKRYPSVQSVILREFYVRYSEPREAVVERHHLEDIEDELRALAFRFDRAYETQTWNPTPGKHCSYCPRPEACPIPPFARGDGAIENAEQAEKTAARLVVAKAAYDQSHEALKSWVSAHGPVPVRAAKGKRAYGYSTSKRVSRPKKEDVEATLAVGGDVTKLWKETTSTRFGQYTPKADEEVDKDFMAELEASLKAANGPG